MFFSSPGVVERINCLFITMAAMKLHLMLMAMWKLFQHIPEMIVCQKSQMMPFPIGLWEGIVLMGEAVMIDLNRKEAMTPFYLLFWSFGKKVFFILCWYSELYKNLNTKCTLSQKIYAPRKKWATITKLHVYVIGLGDVEILTSRCIVSLTSRCYDVSMLQKI